MANRDTAPMAYSAAAVVAAPTYLKWLLCFEDPQSRTLWLGKALPRDWLVQGEAPLVADSLTTRYGRISFQLQVATSKAGVYTVRANVTLPVSFATSGPAGGLRLRVRAPLEHAGKLSSVTVGGMSWSAFDAAEETIDVCATVLTAELIKNGLPDIVATFGATKAVQLRSSL